LFYNSKHPSNHIYSLYDVHDAHKISSPLKQNMFYVPYPPNDIFHKSLPINNSYLLLSQNTKHEDSS
jgi:hypothetical protein